MLFLDVEPKEEGRAAMSDGACDERRALRGAAGSTSTVFIPLLRCHGISLPVAPKPKPPLTRAEALEAIVLYELVS